MCENSYCHLTHSAIARVHRKPKKEIWTDTMPLLVPAEGTRMQIHITSKCKYRPGLDMSIGTGADPGNRPTLPSTRPTVTLPATDHH